MKNIAITVAVAGLIGTSAFAADLPIKAPPPVAPPPFSWTGFYVGATVGYGWRTLDNTASIVQTSDFNFPVSFAADYTINKVRGLIGGIEAGYNWQSGNFLFGIETDFSASNVKGTNEFNSSFPVPDITEAPQRVNLTDNTRLKWLGTTRGRIGYVKDQWLIFATGGVAYGRVELDGNAQLPLPTTDPVHNAPWVWNNSETKVGWAVGVGTEYAVTRNFSLKAEYLYVDLGDVTANVSGGVGQAFSLAANCYGFSSPGFTHCALYRNPASGTVSSDFAINIVRLGANYRF